MVFPGKTTLFAAFFTGLTFDTLARVPAQTHAENLTGPVNHSQRRSLLCTRTHFATCMLLFSLQLIYGFIMGFARIGMDALHEFIPFNTTRATHTNLLVVVGVVAIAGFHLNWWEGRKFLEIPRPLDFSSWLTFWPSSLTSE